MSLNMGGAVVAIENLSAEYGGRRVLEDVSMQVMAGEIMAVMGGSGAGKSTLMRHMLGLKVPEEGTVHLFGQNIFVQNKKQLRKLRRRIGVAFQGGAMFSSLSLRENIELPLIELTRLDRSTIRIMSRMKMQMVGLAEYEHLMPSELSGGMLKRAALARAIIADPQLLFIDEPSSGLDPVTAVEIDELILKLRTALNMTIVVVTHEIDSALKIADKITVLSSGRVLITDTVEGVNASTDQRVQNLLQRLPGDRAPDGVDYLRDLFSES